MGADAGVPLMRPDMTFKEWLEAADEEVSHWTRTDFQRMKCEAISVWWREYFKIRGRNEHRA